MANPRDLPPEEREAFHQEAESRLQIFTYEAPEGTERVKDIVPLCKTDLLRIHVQVVKEGGENNLHYHVNSDTCWMVLRGRVRFYGVGDKILGELGPHEGIMIPGGSRYWFEKAGDEPLEILQMVGIDRARGRDRRINLDTHKDWMQEKELQNYE
jgi:mannose-6-phosphate isomerase-like protein (cupin superfamily)